MMNFQFSLFSRIAKLLDFRGMKDASQDTASLGIYPSNMNEEREKWLFDPKYNPQFRYPVPVSIEKLEKRFGPVTYHLQKIAEKVLEYVNGPDDWGSKYLTKEEIRAQAQQYIAELGVESLVKVEVRQTGAKRSMVRGLTVIFSSKPNRYPVLQFPAILAHEIGTHILRRVQEEQQPWHKSPNLLPSKKPYIETEEGLAVLNGMIAIGKEFPLDASISYLGVIKAQTESYAQLAQWMIQWQASPTVAFRRTISLKLGLEDGSQPGGPSKQQIYFRGFIKVLDWIKRNPTEYWKLYLGKLALEDLDRALQVPGVKTDVVLPVEYTKDPDAYMEQVEIIWKRLRVFDPSVFSHPDTGRSSHSKKRSVK